MSSDKWIGVDLDGTLARYDTWKGFEFVGEPVPLMMARVKEWIADGITVKIFTARVADPLAGDFARKCIQDWCEKHGLPRLEVTATKDFRMEELWDDRAVRVQHNTGRVV